jgi:DNA-binding NtrC family response regulator
MTASILVVDDESTTQDTLGTFLETEGYHVSTAGSGADALSRIEAQEFDVIVADVVMPGVGGFEVLERSRLLNPGAAVILMTGHATVEMAIEVLRKGACDYLQKPFVLHDLGRCVQRLLRRDTGQPDAARPSRIRPPLESEDRLVGASDPVRLVREQIARAPLLPATCSSPARPVPARSWSRAPSTRRAPAATAGSWP